MTSHINFLNITIFQEIEFLTEACSIVTVMVQNR